MNELHKQIMKSEALAEEIGDLLHQRSVSLAELVAAFACLTCDKLTQIAHTNGKQPTVDDGSKATDLFRELVVGYFLSKETIQ